MTDLGSRGHCCFCHEPVTRAQTAAWPVIGWEADRGGKAGTNHILARQRIRDGRIAHKACVVSFQKVSPGQETLI